MTIKVVVTEDLSVETVKQSLSPTHLYPAPLPEPGEARRIWTIGLKRID